ncbi:MAG: SIMPL domain-containing protein [Pseudomonadota bacterium]
MIEAIGRAKLELAPNRGQFSVQFVETDRNSKAAMEAAVERARGAYAAIKAVAAEQSEVTTSVSVSPYYEQYRDRDGDRIENRRADKVIGYEARVSVQVLIKDVGLAGDARAAALALGPEQSDPLRIYLEHTADVLRLAYEAAVQDGSERARLSAAAAQARLGPLLVIQEGQGPCLGQWMGIVGNTYTNREPRANAARKMSTVSVTASRLESVPSVSPADIEALNLPSDRPVQTIEAQVCMIYAIGE